jgi:hypothetical protein
VHGAGGAHEVRLVGELLDLLVVDDQAVDAGDRLQQLRPRDLDPHVHRVHGHEAGLAALHVDRALEAGVDVGQEQRLGGARRL